MRVLDPRVYASVSCAPRYFDNSNCQLYFKCSSVANVKIFFIQRYCMDDVCWLFFIFTMKKKKQTKTKSE